MAASVELKRVAREAEAGISGIQSALDRLERVLPYYVSLSLATELDGLSANEVIDSNIDKDRLQESITLAASIVFYLRAMKDAGGTNTILGTAALNAAALKASIDKLGI